MEYGAYDVNTSSWRTYAKFIVDTLNDSTKLYLDDIGVDVKSGNTITFLRSEGASTVSWSINEYEESEAIHDYTRYSKDNIVCSTGMTSFKDIAMREDEYPLLIGEWDRGAFTYDSEPINFRMFANNGFKRKSGSTTKTYSSGSSYVPPFLVEIEKFASPTLTITATRSERTNLTVVAQITSFNGDEISASTLKVGDIVIRGGLGTGTIGADGRLTLTKQITNIPTSSLPIKATVTGRGGVSDEATYTLPVAFTTWDVKAGGKEISFGEDATEEDLPSNGLFNCAMDANFKGRLLHNGEEVSGGPTESGIENGWYYEIWPNGKRECWKRLTGTWTLNNANGGMYSTPVIPGGEFPKGLFSDLPALDVNGFALTGDLTLIGIAVSPASETATNKKASKDNFGCFRLVRGNSNTNTAVKYVTLHALQLPEA